MAEDGNILSDEAFRRTQETVLWAESQTRTEPPTREQRRRPADDSPLVVALLLEDIASLKTGQATRLAPTDFPRSWDVRLVGDVASGTFKLKLTLGGIAEFTQAIAFNAPAADVVAALEALEAAEAGDFVVDTWTDSGRWYVHVQQQFLDRQGELPTLAGDDQGLVSQFLNSFNTLVVEETIHKDSGRTPIEVADVIPLGNPTPLITGVIVTTMRSPRYGNVILSAEPRDLFFFEDSYY